LGLLEGLLVNLSRGGGALAGVVLRALAQARGGLPGLARPGASRAKGRPLVLSIVALALLAGATSAYASEASTIIEKCGHNEPFSGYSQNAYREALKQMPTEVSEYSDCANQIRKAELAAAGGGGGAPAAGISPDVALPLTPSEQHAVQSAHRNGAAPVQVGSEPIRPGVVHADIASAVNTLPHSLFAVLAFLLACALGMTIGEVGKRVRARRDS
jgi:hypothetical protein